MAAFCQSPANQPTCIAVQGIPGIPGLPGRDGLKGDKGNTGPPGQGLKGAQGPPGKAGPAAQKGATGSTGPKGNEGMKGATGSPGIPGVPCDMSRVTVLEKQLTNLQKTLASNQKVLQFLGKSWKVGDKTFFTGETMSDFSTAKSECARVGSRMAVPMTEAENKAIEEIVKRVKKDAWIAVSDEKTEGKFIYLDGNPIKYSKWNSGEPNNHNNAEDCASIQTTGKWNDKPCSNHCLVICEL